MGFSDFLQFLGGYLGLGLKPDLKITHKLLVNSVKPSGPKMENTEVLFSFVRRFLFELLGIFSSF